MSTDTDTIVRLINPLPRSFTPNAYIIRTNGTKKEIDSASNIIFSQMSRYILTGGSKHKESVVRFQVETKPHGTEDVNTITYEGKISEKDNARRLKIKRIVIGNDKASSLKIPLGGETVQSGGAILALPPLYDVSTSFLMNMAAFGDQNYINSYLASVVFPAAYYPSYNIAYWNALGYYAYPDYNYIPYLSVFSPNINYAISSTTNPNGSNSTGTLKTDYTTLG